ncbi:MAG: hypothetical protein KJZ75_08070 [Hyphomonadaceae bacterium]|nr:hypothetical protein [Hyphomonadaceae bacterium]
MRLLIAAIAATTLGLAACSQADVNKAEQETSQAADEAGAALDNAAQETGEALHQAGEAVEDATNDAAGAVQRATDDNEATQP